MTAATARRRRARPPLDEVLPVAAVVLGEVRYKLTGWQLDSAVCAMNALGDSSKHIAYWLGLSPDTVSQILSRNGRQANRFDQRLDLLGIYIVALGGHMRLRGQDRIAAIRILARRGLSSAQIARRLLSSTEQIRTLAGEHDIELVDHRANPFEIRAFRCRQERDLLDGELLAA